MFLCADFCTRVIVRLFPPSISVLFFCSKTEENAYRKSNSLQMILRHCECEQKYSNVSYWIFLFLYRRPYLHVRLKANIGNRSLPLRSKELLNAKCWKSLLSISVRQSVSNFRKLILFQQSNMYQRQQKQHKNHYDVKPNGRYYAFQVFRTLCQYRISSLFWFFLPSTMHAAWV